MPIIPGGSSEDSQTGGLTGVVGDLWPPQIGGQGGDGSGSVRPPRPRPPNVTEKPADSRPPIVEMEEEDEYDYDIYDDEGTDSGFSDVTSRPPPSGNPDRPPSGSGNPDRPPPSGNPDKDKAKEEFEIVPGSIFQCPAPGFYPHEDNCREFYVCQGGDRLRLTML